MLFGNLGRAAAAYNAGEKRVRRWLDGSGSLPYETQDYVLSITGHGHEEWKAENASFEIPSIGKEGNFSDQCQKPRHARTLAAGVRGEARQLEALGRGADRRLLGSPRAAGLPRHPQPLSTSSKEDPLVVRKLNRSMGRRKMVRVMIGRDSRSEAQKLCRDLTQRWAASASWRRTDK